MSINLRILAFFVSIILCISHSTAFFLSWGSPDPTPAPPNNNQWPGQFSYHQRLLQSPPQQYTVTQGSADGSQSVPLPIAVPAIPMQVPLKAHLAPAPNLHNVQLVPCLCPVSQDDIEKSAENIYNVKNNLNHNN